MLGDGATGICVCIETSGMCRFLSPTLLHQLLHLATRRLFMRECDPHCEKVSTTVSHYLFYCFVTKQA